MIEALLVDVPGMAVWVAVALLLWVATVPVFARWKRNGKQTSRGER